jgi:ribosome maturation factor RimP
MGAETVVEKVRVIAERVATGYGLEVFDVQFRREAPGMVLRVRIDRPGPASREEDSVSVHDCSNVSRDLSAIFDVEDIVPTAYTLEVSSPGLDRPLRQVEDYRRFAGRLAKLVVSEPVDNQKAFEGRLRGVETDPADGDGVLLEAPNGRIHRLPLRLIARGRLEVEF